MPNRPINWLKGKKDLLDPRTRVAHSDVIFRELANRCVLSTYAYSAFRAFLFTGFKKLGSSAFRAPSVLCSVSHVASYARH
jgi:hypothetical protein